MKAINDVRGSPISLRHLGCSRPLSPTHKLHSLITLYNIMSNGNDTYHQCMLRQRPYIDIIYRYGLWLRIIRRADPRCETVEHAFLIETACLHIMIKFIIFLLPLSFRNKYSVWDFCFFSSQAMSA